MSAKPHSLVVPAVSTVQFIRTLRNRSGVPRVVADPDSKMYFTGDIGYFYRYHRKGVDTLPRIPNCRVPITRPDYKVRNAWCDDQARFGENDYIDLLGDGQLHPAQLQYHTPTWLRGFPGQHRANELIKLIHYRNLYKNKLEKNSPRRWLELNKRLKYLLKRHNYEKQDELKGERDLGLWEEKPDYFYKDKSRRSYEDLV
ncbi:unnamed protein product [Dracunculus medinensis]|uniref:Large ribosomal subunit protein mL51 n=1 Tax=Dracunculus medinensis TaxID=318479 RepID=A0A0N4UE10_DRAME|nr:unnamed protein product [Dracunculus medinensis]